jgi:guanine deaminase
MHEAYLRRAIRLAVDNVRQGRGGPFGAIVVRDGTVIGEGANHVTAANDPTAHAEIVAIREACRKLGRFDLRGCTLYASCEPCPMCLGAVYWARLDALYFAAGRDDAAAAGFDDSLIYAQAGLPPEVRSIPTRALLRDEGLEPFTLWRATASKVPY